VFAETVFYTIDLKFIINFAFIL